MVWDPFAECDSALPESPKPEGAEPSAGDGKAGTIVVPAGDRPHDPERFRRGGGDRRPQHRRG